MANKDYLVFYEWKGNVKLMCKLDTTEEDIRKNNNDVRILEIIEEPYPDTAYFIRERTQFISDNRDRLVDKLNNS